MNWYLSRISLSRSPVVHALEYLLKSDQQGQKRSVQHNMLWSAFAENSDQKRDFLWRAESDGSFLALSPRLPREDNELFTKPIVKPFTPCLKAGDRLSFQLQANATRMKRDIRKRVDVVMDALHSVSQEERAGKRMEIAQKEGFAWLARQGEKAGFRLESMRVEDYRVERLPRLDEERRKKAWPQFGILDMVGQLEVTDPEAFLAQLVRGFGRAKAFGCGLMLIRRAS